MHILVTGGAGFIGSHLCEYLLKQGNKVVCLDNFSADSKDNIVRLLEDQKFKLFRCDVRDKDKLLEIFKQEKIELVYHLAAIVGVNRTLERPKEVFEVNINGTVNVLETALKSGCEKVVNISSSEVYGNPVEVREKGKQPEECRITLCYF